MPLKARRSENIDRLAPENSDGQRLPRSFHEWDGGYRVESFDRGNQMVTFRLGG